MVTYVTRLHAEREHTAWPTPKYRLSFPYLAA